MQLCTALSATSDCGCRGSACGNPQALPDTASALMKRVFHNLISGEAKKHRLEPRKATAIFTFQKCPVVDQGRSPTLQVRLD
jgi:hypothetical protein